MSRGCPMRSAAEETERSLHMKREQRKGKARRRKKYKEKKRQKQTHLDRDRDRGRGRGRRADCLSGCAVDTNQIKDAIRSQFMFSFL